MTAVTVLPRLDAPMTPKEKHEYLEQIRLATELQNLCNTLELAVEKRAAMARVLARPETQQMLEEEALKAIQDGFTQQRAEREKELADTVCARKDREQSTRATTLTNDHKTAAVTGASEATYTPSIPPPPEPPSTPMFSDLFNAHPDDPVASTTSFGGRKP